MRDDIDDIDDIDTLKKRLQAAVAKIVGLKKEAQSLKAEREQIESRASSITVRLREITGSQYGGRGEIDEQSCVIKNMELRIAQTKGRKVEWIDPGHWHSGHWVIEKVTPKRIYVYKFSNDRSEHFNLDGTAVSRGNQSKIDIAKTFPEGVENFEH